MIRPASCRRRWTSASRPARSPITIAVTIAADRGLQRPTAAAIGAAAERPDRRASLRCSARAARHHLDERAALDRPDQRGAAARQRPLVIRHAGIEVHATAAAAAQAAEHAPGRHSSIRSRRQRRRLSRSRHRRAPPGSRTPPGHSRRRSTGRRHSARRPMRSGAASARRHARYEPTNADVGAGAAEGVVGGQQRRPPGAVPGRRAERGPPRQNATRRGAARARGLVPPRDPGDGERRHDDRAQAVKRRAREVAAEPPRPPAVPRPESPRRCASRRSRCKLAANGNHEDHEGHEEDKQLASDQGDLTLRGLRDLRGCISPHAPRRAAIASGLALRGGNSCVVVLQRADAEALLRSARMALTAAAAPVSVVMHGTSCIIAARRTARSSKNDSRPSGVFTTSSILPLTISSAMFGRPSFTLYTTSTSRP